MKKILFLLLGIITLGLINFSSAVEYSCSDSSFTISEDSYFIINYAGGSRAGYFDVGKDGTFEDYCFNSNRGITVDTSCSPINSYPLILSAGTRNISCTNITVSSFSVFPSACDYSDYELKTDITENYCKNKFSSLITSSECDSLYSGYVSPILYQNCTNSLNSCSGELGVCNGNLNSCLNGNYSGDVQWSSIWINNIQHLGNKNIYVDIPEEISWDYLYTGDNMFIDVEGYNVDTEYIQSILDIQSYHPDKDQFAQSFAGFLTLLMPYIIITLFIIFVWRLIKRIFR